MALRNRRLVKDADIVRVRLDEYQLEMLMEELNRTGGEKGPLARELMLEGLRLREEQRKKNNRAETA